MTTFDLDLTKYSLGWSDEAEYAFTPEKGLNESVVEQISWWKGEPDWMRQTRLRSLRTFEKKPMAPWFASLPASPGCSLVTTQMKPNAVCRTGLAPANVSLAKMSSADVPGSNTASMGPEASAGSEDFRINTAKSGQFERTLRGGSDMDVAVQVGASEYDDDRRVRPLGRPSIDRCR